MLSYPGLFLTKNINHPPAPFFILVNASNYDLILIRLFYSKQLRGNMITFLRRGLCVINKQVGMGVWLQEA